METRFLSTKKVVSSVPVLVTREDPGNVAMAVSMLYSSAFTPNPGRHDLSCLDHQRVQYSHVPSRVPHFVFPTGHTATEHNQWQVGFHAEWYQHDPHQ